MPSANKNLHKARESKNDEYYTQLSDIEQELEHYKHHFKGKTVYCNCDDPRVSNFFYYFSYNFEQLGLKKLIATCYRNKNIHSFSQNDSELAVYIEYNGNPTIDSIQRLEDLKVDILKSDGDFRNTESIELLKQADIVVTNPPFSMFREYIAQLVEYDKKFLIVGHQNAITYKEIFPLLKDNKVWLGAGVNGKMQFKVPSYYEARPTRFWVDGDGQKWQSLGNACWFTNLDLPKRHKNLILHKEYTPEEYPKYENFDAINVDKITNIPKDYSGMMGVPITFMSKYNPTQFGIIKFRKGDDDKDLCMMIKGVRKTPYFRIIVKNRALST